jgi:hypothetical protein
MEGVDREDHVEAFVREGQVPRVAHPKIERRVAASAVQPATGAGQHRLGSIDAGHQAERTGPGQHLQGVAGATADLQHGGARRWVEGVHGRPVLQGVAASQQPGHHGAGGAAGGFSLTGRGAHGLAHAR